MFAMDLVPTTILLWVLKRRLGLLPSPIKLPYLRHSPQQGWWWTWGVPRCLVSVEMIPRCKCLRGCGDPVKPSTLTRSNLWKLEYSQGEWSKRGNHMQVTNKDDDETLCQTPIAPLCWRCNCLVWAWRRKFLMKLNTNTKPTSFFQVFSVQFKNWSSIPPLKPLLNSIRPRIL